MYVTMNEKLSAVNGFKDKGEQISLLRIYAKQYSQFVDYLRMGFDPNFKFNLPEGAPPYTRNHDIVEHAGSNLIREHRKLQHVMHNSGHPQLKREMLFVQMLEAVSGIESEFLLAIHLGTLPEMYKNISVDTINEAFPNLINLDSPPPFRGSDGVDDKGTKELQKETPKPIPTLEDMDTQKIRSQAEEDMFLAEMERKIQVEKQQKKAGRPPKNKM
jgi:hypothetical protein